MRWLFLGLALLLGTARIARADDVLFYWVDKRGTVHATQDLDEVPEPYRAMYRARLKELEEEKKKQKAAPPVVVESTPSPAPRPPANPQNSIVERERARQKSWRDEMSKWRTELRVATEDLQRIQTQIDQTQMNPVLRTTPQVQAQLEPLEEQRQKALTRVEIARKRLAEELPQRAKRESVPPAWLD